MCYNLISLALAPRSEALFAVIKESVGSGSAAMGPDSQADNPGLIPNVAISKH